MNVAAHVTIYHESIACEVLCCTRIPEFHGICSAKRNRWGYNAGASLSVPTLQDSAILGSSETVLRGNSHEVSAALGVKLTF